MNDHEQHQMRVDYFNTRYRKVAQHWFTTEEPTALRDHLDGADRWCRFCGPGEPPTTFHDLAHAVPDFLGNFSIISLNECDESNGYFGRGCEDDLSKATMFPQTLTGIPRKKGPKSIFKSTDDSLRIDADGHKVDIRVPAPDSVDDLMADGRLPESIPLTGDTRSQPYVPVRATMALVKPACSVCPRGEHEQCRGAIEWARGRRAVRFSTFPVLFAFTPGTFDERLSYVTLLRRKDDGPEPYLWCVVQFRNFRFQVSVPFCPADAG